MGAYLVLIGFFGAIVSLVLLVIKAIKKQSKKRSVIAFVVCFVLLVIGVVITPRNDDPEIAESANSVVDEEQTVSTNEETSSESNQVIDSDMDIITRDGHPTYYGSVSSSHNVWKDVKKGKIHFADKVYGQGDKPILSMSCNRNSDIIRGIFIDFDNFDINTKVTLEEALAITSSYMPYEIMDKYYEFGSSRLIVPNEDKQDDDSYYVITYRLTEEGGKAYYAKEHDYSGSIDVIIEGTADDVKYSEIRFGTPRWMSSLDKNGYHSEAWTYDFYDNK